MYVDYVNKAFFNEIPQAKINFVYYCCKNRCATQLLYLFVLIIFIHYKKHDISNYEHLLRGGLRLANFETDPITMNEVNNDKITS